VHPGLCVQTWDLLCTFSFCEEFKASLVYFILFLTAAVQVVCWQDYQ